VRWILQQLLDLLAYWLLPFICFLLPARPANALARFIAGRGWFFRRPAANALANVSAVMPVADPEAWQTEFRLVQFLDAVDVWHGRFSSDRRIARQLVTGPEAWPTAARQIFLGSHLGPSTLVLRCMAAAGLKPAFIYRRAQVDLKRRAPVLHAYQRWRVGYLTRVCEGREVSAPGGRDAVRRLFREPVCCPVLLVDAPAPRDHGVALDIGGGRLPVDPRGVSMAVAEGLLATPFVMFWDPASGRRKIKLGQSAPLTDTDLTLRRMNELIDRWVRAHPAQWQLWLTAQPVVGGTVNAEG
jgi:lauroyl/myristoyl acyltransferase